MKKCLSEKKDTKYDGDWLRVRFPLFLLKSLDHVRLGVN